MKVHRGIVPPTLVTHASRLIWEDVRFRGLRPEEMDEWERVSCPFPHLRFDPDIMAVREFLVDHFDLGGLVPCEPQLIFQLPDGADFATPYAHVDEPPPWADGRPYERILGVALSEWGGTNGTVGEPDGDGGYWSVTLSPGDVVDIPPALPHFTLPNRGGQVRLGVYFRFLSAKRLLDDGD